MCGLLGLIAASGNAEDFVQATSSSLSCMRHRGPDEDGTWNDSDVVYGFNRLSIIDLAHSHQPLQWGPDGQENRYALTFNGEIYNYQELRSELKAHGYTFATDGDSETIVVGYHHWGHDVVQHLRGMFAFAVWDSIERTMFLARDQFGIKPLYWATTPKGTFFGSEKKCLLSIAQNADIDVSLDKRAVEHYMDLQYVPEPESLNTGIRRLESGCCATVTPGHKPNIHRWFTPQFPVKTVSKEKLDSEISKIQEALENSVAQHMRADVTVGSFLSGGIDSTAIAALAKQHNPDLLTFTTGFEREGYSEIDVAAESAEAIGVKHIVKIVSPDEFAEAVPRIIWYLDDPVADPALVPLYFVAAEARKHVKVVLSGEGADELFGGYNIYHEPLSLAGFDKIPNFAKKGLRSAAQRLPEGVRGKSFLERGTTPLEERYYGNARSFSFAQLQRVIPWARKDWNHTDITAPIYAQSRGWDPVARMQHLDLFTWLRGDILVKADNMTMANSLELRVPFLDKEVFAVAQTLPTSMKLTQGTSKWALRQAMERIVPPHVLHRRKLGFPVPIRHWLAGDELYSWAQDIITSSHAGDIVDLDATRSMLEEHRLSMSSGSGPDHSRRLWTVLAFLIWYGIFVDNTITPDIPEPTYPVEV